MRFQANFSKDRETKTTIVFKEDGDVTTHKIGTLYIKKTAMPKEPPETITVSVDMED